MQVNQKASNLIRHLNTLSGPILAYAYIYLSNRFANQCECQVSMNNTSAFPLAEVAVAITRQHPGFEPVLMARLQKVNFPFFPLQFHRLSYVCILRELWYTGPEWCIAYYFKFCYH